MIIHPAVLALKAIHTQVAPGKVACTAVACIPVACTAVACGTAACTAVASAEVPAGALFGLSETTTASVISAAVACRGGALKTAPWKTTGAFFLSLLSFFSAAFVSFSDSCAADSAEGLAAATSGIFAATVYSLAELLS